MNDMASIRKMRPLEPAGSAGSLGAVSGLAAVVSGEDFFFGAKGRFYLKYARKTPLKLRLKRALDRTFSRKPSTKPDVCFRVRRPQLPNSGMFVRNSSQFLRRIPLPATRRALTSMTMVPDSGVGEDPPST